MSACRNLPAAPSPSPAMPGRDPARPSASAEASFCTASSFRVPPSHLRPARSGFTLVEVTLALLVIAIGMLSLFQLFPAGLRENMLSRADLRQSMFAEYVLSGVEARAAAIGPDWNTWNGNAFKDAVRDGLTADGVEHSVGSGEWNGMRYRLTMTHDANSRVWRIWVQSSENKVGNFTANPYYTTEVFFMGVP